jgi:hypothetical protein
MRKAEVLLFHDENTRKAELLTLPLSKLPVTLNGEPVGGVLRAVKERMEEMGFVIRPNFYLGVEYSCCMGTGNISIPFWDTNETLRELCLEAGKTLFTLEELPAVIWHEIGHAFCYLYKLYRTRAFRRVFNVKGHFFNTYPSRDYFKKRPWSREYVNLTGDHYAQKHPDDDFAETFATVMVLGKKWRKVYRFKPGAYMKLEWTEGIIKKLKRKPPVVENDPSIKVKPLEEFNIPLYKFLGVSPRRYIKNATGYLDHYLTKIFSKNPKKEHLYLPLSEVIKNERRLLVERISKATEVKKEVISDILKKFSVRGDEIGLFVKKKDLEKKMIELVSLVSALAEGYKHKGNFMIGG